MKEFDINTLVRPNIAAMKPYTSARDEFKEVGADMVFLDANENPFENGVNRYPDPQQRDLKSLIARQHGRLNENILVGNGSDEVLDLIYRAFCRPGVDNVITLPPTYGMYKVLAATNDIENREVLLTDQFQPNVAGIQAAVDAKTKIVFLCSPNNPTGNLIDKSAINELLESFQGLVVIDEAYIDFCLEHSRVDGIEAFPNLIVTKTASKAYGMAGVRLGLAFASSDIITILNKIKPPYNVNTLSLEKAYNRFANLGSVALEVDAILDARTRLMSALRVIPYVKQVYPSDANFVLCRVDDAERRYTQLIQKGIVVRNRSSQPLCENTLRFTVGSTEEINTLIEALNIIA